MCCREADKNLCKRSQHSCRARGGTNLKAETKKIDWGDSVPRDHAGELFFRRPDGKAVPYSGYCQNDQMDSGSELDTDGVDPVVVEYLKNSREFSGVEESGGVYDLSYRRERGYCQIAA